MPSVSASLKSEIEYNESTHTQQDKQPRNNESVCENARKDTYGVTATFFASSFGANGPTIPLIGHQDLAVSHCCLLPSHRKLLRRIFEAMVMAVMMVVAGKGDVRRLDHPATL